MTVSDVAPASLRRPSSQIVQIDLDALRDVLEQGIQAGALAGGERTKHLLRKPGFDRGEPIAFRPPRRGQRQSPDAAVNLILRADDQLMLLEVAHQARDLPIPIADILRQILPHLILLPSVALLLSDDELGHETVLALAVTAINHPLDRTFAHAWWISFSSALPAGVVIGLFMCFYMKPKMDQARQVAHDKRK